MENMALKALRDETTEALLKAVLKEIYRAEQKPKLRLRRLKCLVAVLNTLANASEFLT